MKNINNIWIKSIGIFLILFPISVFFHEIGHWIIYELNGVDSWISLQKVNPINPDKLTDAIFLNSLFGGPIITILIALISYLFLRKYRNSIWLLVLGIINAAFRIIPTTFGIFRAARTDNLGFSDEGNIALRLTDSVFLRLTIMLLYITFCIFLIIRIYRTFKFPENFKRRILLIITLCILTVLISMAYPILDNLIFEF
ncbi:hypothetical protein RXV94_06025 [Yeosuana sp. MJ-SS3]|uniref:Peptidase M50 domain-containing protein n=1 Tax=Gilvirhabdus luticola TaxID=3079858 RepID=A0ABU3U5M2_9FLAO|nr:hypothetical protein [Yeosuana sp. MJ-SS3]MDU8885710.1 hypothetical protein [Yeosuana sp. MJ-SS3]